MPFALADATTVALRELRKLGIAETPATADTNAAGVRAAALVAELNRRQVWNVTNSAAIDDAFYEPFVVILAEHLRPEFTNDNQPVDIQRRQEAELRLKLTYVLETTQATALVRAVLAKLVQVGAPLDAIDAGAVSLLVPQVFADLSARRIVTIANEAGMSSAQQPHIVTLIAARASPKAFEQAISDVEESQLAASSRLDRTQTSALAKAVLEKLDALGKGSAAVDYAAVTGAIQSVLDELAARRVISIANEAALTSAQMPAVIDLVIARLRPDAVSPDMVAAAAQTLADISRLDRTTSTDATVLMVRRIIQRLRVDAAPVLEVYDAQAITDELQSIVDDLNKRANVYIPDVETLTTNSDYTVFVAEFIKYAAASLANAEPAKAQSLHNFKILRAKSPSYLPLSTTYF